MSIEGATVSIKRHNVIRCDHFVNSRIGDTDQVLYYIFSLKLFRPQNMKKNGCKYFTIYKQSVFSISKISTFTIYDKFTIYDERYGCKYILYIYIAAMMLKTKLHLL